MHGGCKTIGSNGLVFGRTSMLGIAAYRSVIFTVGIFSLHGNVFAREKTMDQSNHKQLVERFLAAYNSFDIETMVTLLAVGIQLENYSGEVLTAAATGIDEFRELAEQSKALFSEREQRIISFECREGAVLVVIQFHGRLAADMPHGPAAGTILNLPGTSEYFFRDGKIIKLVDRSGRKQTVVTVNYGSSIISPLMLLTELNGDQMSNDDGERSPVGVVVTIRDLGGGQTRVSLDDVQSDSTRRETHWTFDLFYTHKDLNTAAVDSMQLPSAEYEGLGAAILARLLALNGRVA